MTLKTSFFNKGIYKSAVKRYIWGAVLYFVVLFMSTGLSVLLNSDRDFSHLPYDYFKDYSVILHGSYIGIPIFLALIVPTVVALLIFRFIHSKKQAIFTHSLPCSRRAIFVSSVSAAFTLMLVPILLNGIILVLLSVSAFGRFFTVADCMVWMGLNAFGVFLMFSCSAFSAMLTGNSFAMIAINIILHGFLFVTAVTLGVMADVFLYGFNNVNYVYDILAENNFAVVVFQFIDRNFRADLTSFKLCEFSFFALVLYVLSYILYKKRRIETVGDVAGFKCLNHVLKYLVTFLVTMFGFAVFSSYIAANITVFVIICIIVSAIAYFASEMVLKKTVSVLYAWKGYVGFAVFFICLSSLFAFTSFFGFETKVPEADKVEEATIYNYYYVSQEPYTDDRNVIDMIIKTHGEFTDEVPALNTAMRYTTTQETRIHIRYKLKDGKVIQRVYPVAMDKNTEIMNEFYESENYKKTCEAIFIDDSLIVSLRLNGDIELKDKDEFLDLIRKDVLELDYEQLRNIAYDGPKALYDVRVEFKAEEINDSRPRAMVNAFYMEITEDFKNTVKWLEENGYQKLEYR